MDFFTELLTAWLGSDSDIEVHLTFAYRIRPIRVRAKYPRDIILQFDSWSVKTKIIASYREQTEVIVADSQLLVYPDLSKITLINCKTLKFLTEELQKRKLSYRWGFPFKLSLTYSLKNYVIKSVAEAKTFLKLIER